MKNKFKLIGLLSTFSILATACTPPLWFIDNDQPQYANRETLVFNHQWQRGAVGFREVNDVITKFNESEEAKRLNVAVKGNGINFWDYWDKTDLSLHGGTGPDIYLHTVQNLAVREKYNLNLNEMYQKDVDAGKESLNAATLFYPNQLADLQRFTEGDGLYGWPFSATVRAIYYNKKMFQEAGISTSEFPRTWAEIDELSRRMTTYNTPGVESSGYKVVGFDPFTGEGQYIHTWGWLAGHNFWGEDERGRPVPRLNDPTLATNLEKIINCYVRKDAQARTNLKNFMLQFGATGKEPFISGKLGMVVGNEGLNARLEQAGEELGFEWGVFKLPTMDETIETTNWSSSFSIELLDNNGRTNISEEKAKQRNEGSWAFLKYLNSREPQKFFADAGFMIANRLYHDDFINIHPVKKQLAESIPYAREAEYFKAVASWTSEIQIYTNNVFAVPPTQTIQESLQSSQELLQSKIDKYYALNP